MQYRKAWVAAFAVTLALAAAAPARAADLTKYLPSDAAIVVSVDVRGLLDSPVAKKYFLDKLKTSLKSDPTTGKALDAMGLDPLKDVDFLVVGMSSFTDPNKAVIVGSGHFQLDKIDKAAQDFAKKNPDQLSISKSGSTTVYAFKGSGSDTTFAAFPDGSTAVLAQSKSALDDALKNAGTGPKFKKEMSDAMGKVDTKSTVWVAALATDDLKAQMKNIPVPGLADNLISLTLEVKVSDAVDVKAGIYTKDAKSAKDLKDLLDTLKGTLAGNPGVPPVVGDILKGLTITQDGNSVKASLKLTSDMIDKLMKLNGG